MEQIPEKFSLPSEDEEEIKKAVEYHRSLPENKEKKFEDIVKSSIQSIAPVSDENKSKNLEKDSNSELPAYMSGQREDYKEEVRGLLDLAKNKGIKKASASALKKSPFILDAFHDALVKKIIKEEIVK